MRNKVVLLILAGALLLTGCNPEVGSGEVDFGDVYVDGSEIEEGQSGEGSTCVTHVDKDGDTWCDICEDSVIVYVDFYAVNDLHGKIADGDSQPGVDELSTYLKEARKKDDHVIVLSTGDMWQGSSESNTTQGLIMTEWMNEMDFVGMALGNHEYDWGEDAIEKNLAIADFPFLAINIYDKDTNKPVEYCQPSVMVEAGGLKIGIIGAIGDCYSSIAKDKTKEIYFKVGDELTELVKEEANDLRMRGADCVVYALHDGYDDNITGMSKPMAASKFASYYDVELSDGYVDLVFEAHTHKEYIFQDEHGVYHLQHRGDNSGGISHVEMAINSISKDVKVNLASLVEKESYENLEDDPIVETLLDKYEDKLASTTQKLGTNKYFRDGDVMCQIVANLYYTKGVEKWGDKYDIALGGGCITIRNPYELPKGNVTYSQLQTLFPFDNEIVLCSIKGRDLQFSFFENDNEDYFIAYGDYGKSIMDNIDPDKTYYVVTDTYSSTYKPNRLTEIERYETGVYARDLLAELAKDGGFKKKY